jgi:DNA-binding transcriptional MerR regulator
LGGEKSRQIKARINLLDKYSNGVIINCMKKDNVSIPASFPLAELCVLADLPPRTVRYYVQIGLVDRPEGETRAARYGARHLEQLLLIKKWTAAGVSLDRIRDLLQGEQAPVPPRPRAVGAVEVRSHLTVADGVEVVIEPGRAGLSPEQVRSFVKGVMTLYARLSGGEAGQAGQKQGHEQESEGAQDESV